MWRSLTLATLIACTGGSSPKGDDSTPPTDDTSDPVADDSGDPTTGDTPPGTTLKGSTERDTDPDTADLPTLGRENAEFSLSLLRTVRGLERGNQVLSPWSLQVVMGQVLAGAAGDTKTVISDAMGWTLAEPDIHEAMDAADLKIQAHDDASADPPVTITSTNQIFVTVDRTPEAAWLDTLSTWYGTGVQQMDFETDPAAVASEINAWISARTGGHIDDLITELMVTTNKMLLVNALYFKASWAVPFSESSTSELPFTLEDGSRVDVTTMSGAVTVRGAFMDGYTVADIPYSDGGLTMTLVVPDAERFSEIADGLTWTQLEAAIDSAEWCSECNTQLPKFKIESKPPVQGALEAMGMAAAFYGDYSNIHPTLTLTGIDQAGFIEVNEKGTEAAAATVAEFSDSASIPPFDELIVDRPFLFFVRERETMNILFAGVVMDPRQ